MGAELVVVCRDIYQHGVAQGWLNLLTAVRKKTVLKGRYREDRLEDDHQLTTATYPVLRLQDGVVARCHLRDPSWFQWPLLEAAIEGNIIADFPLCNKSFNCSYSGVDL